MQSKTRRSGSKKQNHSSRKVATRPTIAFLVDRIFGTGTYSSEMWRGIIQAVREHDVNLICYTGGFLQTSFQSDQYEYQRNVIYNLISDKCVDGVIICTAAFVLQSDADVLSRFCLQYLPLPTVCVGVPVEGTINLQVDNLRYQD